MIVHTGNHYLFDILINLEFTSKTLDKGKEMEATKILIEQITGQLDDTVVGVVPAAKSGKKKPKKKSKSKTSKMNGTQTEPPSIPITTLFPNSVYPVGEEMQYKEE